MATMHLALSFFNVLHTAVHIKRLARALPVHLAVDELGNDVDHLVSGTDELSSRVAFAVAKLASSGHKLRARTGG